MSEYPGDAQFAAEEAERRNNKRVRSNDDSARPCGCDPGAKWTCDWHRDLGVDYTIKKEALRPKPEPLQDGGTGPFTRAVEAEVLRLGQLDSDNDQRELVNDGRRIMASREALGETAGKTHSGYYDDICGGEAPRDVSIATAGAANIGQGAGCNSTGNNAQQSQFQTGATRSTSEGKIDFEGHIHPEVLQVYGEYMHRHRVQRDGQLRASDNWQEGIPVYRYVKSFVRHGIEFWRMWRGTAVVNPDSGAYFTFGDVLCALMFNIMGIIYELKTRNSVPGIAPYLDSFLVTTATRKSLERQGQPKTYDMNDVKVEQVQSAVRNAVERERDAFVTEAKIKEAAEALRKQADAFGHRDMPLGRPNPSPGFIHPTPGFTAPPSYNEVIPADAVQALNLRPGKYRLTITREDA